MKGRPAKKINYENNTKLCPMCETWKPFDEFYKRGKRISGGPYCKSCEVERQLLLQHDKRSIEEIFKLINQDIEMLVWRKKYLKDKHRINLNLQLTLPFITASLK